MKKRGGRRGRVGEVVERRGRASLSHLLELLDLSLVKHGEDIGAPFRCRPSLGLLGCL